MASSLVIFIDSKENSVGQIQWPGASPFQLQAFVQIDIYLTFKSELFVKVSVYFLFVKRVKHEKLPLPFHSIQTLRFHLNVNILTDRRASTLQQ